jgi:glucosamine 6-phosphate synthetase-like amidotransferase/phosphosugar isomerase protein
MLTNQLCDEVRPDRQKMAIDLENTVIVIAPHDAVFEKTVSNMQEVAARGGRIVLIGDATGAAAHGLETLATVTITISLNNQ